MADLPPPTLRLTVDRAALATNWRALDRMSGAARAGAAVKADGYGLGARLVAETLWEAGCRDFFVAHWSEVPDLLEVVPPEAIAVLHGPINAEEAAYARAVGARPILNSIHQARLWNAAGGGPCHLMLDTGMNRLGLPLAELDAPEVAALDIHVLMSHLHSADEDGETNERQRIAFDAARTRIAHREASLANSAGIALGDGYHYDLTRPGLSLYGGVPRPELADVIRQVARIDAAIMQTRELQAGETVGYNATFTAPHAMRIGTVALGYADGYLRCWSGKGAMRSGDARLPVLGRVSMDMTAIDLTHAPDLAEGDWVRAEYDLPEAARVSGLSQYELLTALGSRFLRA
ncbi:alanine racemase [Blastomonas marina]|uniref:alanine racemase n=1 Tax=Blastomonas marina TaxID=1867408 RepID=UPI002AC971DF|nr:alanine racemase [Blastomonas marina]WPZ04744.1 alanine racemase [Blastomonas marina]